MNIYIWLFLAFGCFFGLASFTHRHLFSEGPHKPHEVAPEKDWVAIGFWVAICTLLWPLMVVSGLNTAWILARRRSRARTDRQ
ncbi:MAG: hypothetical protein RIS88_568 [Pseudomonadota bacterium]|jgi:ABC-type sulfate transport system permease subunit